MTKTVDMIKLPKVKYENIQKKMLQALIEKQGESISDAYCDVWNYVDDIRFDNEYNNIGYCQGNSSFKQMLCSVYIKNKDLYYDFRLCGLRANIEDHDYGSYDGSTSPEYVKMEDFCGFSGEFPSFKEIKYFFETSGDYQITYNDRSYNGVIFAEGQTLRRLTTYNNCDIQNMGSGNGRYYERQMVFPVHHLHGIDVESTEVSTSQILADFLKYNLIPDDHWFIDDKIRESFSYLISICNGQYKYFKDENDENDENDEIVLDLELIYKEALEGKIPFFMTEREYNKIMSTVIQADIEEVQDFVDSFLECDYNRAGIDRYDENILIDPNRGHWDLWDMDDNSADDGGIVKLSKPWVARNPVADINSGIVAIDFGTKSTVVVYKNENSEILPLQVGSGNYAGGIKKENYENPTIVQFLDINSFMKAYNAKAGRPDTSYEDITVSSNAKQNLDVSSSTEYYSFFDELKQWCGGSREKVKIEDKQGNTYDLPAYLDLLDTDIDPIEIYAYYLGLYINNMLQEKHIFMHYIMSFPVNYERNIREKLLRSFAKGLKKSLPTALLSNEEAMKRFKVVEGATEPAAYACTALSEFGFSPVDEEQNYYGVFDFGGGTTDFDFGWLEELDDGRYDYKLTHFGENGDRTLGGENILKLLAFEVFAANYESLLKVDDQGSKIPFCKAPDSTSFVGSEAIIRESREAKQNMHNLMEKLRPVWENPTAECTKNIFEKRQIEVNLFTDKGEQKPNFLLELKDLDLPAIIRKRIDKGINNFFVSLNEAFRLSSDIVKPLSQIDTFYIFMAGNASKSALVKEVFAEYTDGSKPKAQTLLGVLQGGKMPKFMLLPPLGTAEADNIIKRSINIITENVASDEQVDNVQKSDEDAAAMQDKPGADSSKQAAENAQERNDENLLRPTGKTGVAYGLLETCAGGSIKVVNITNNCDKEVAFQYYIGRSRKKKFYTVLGHGASYNQWVDFMDASDDFDILYTTQPAAANNNAPLTIAKRKHIVLTEKMPDCRVYIKPVASTAIVYTIAKKQEECPKNEDAGELIRIDFD